MPMPSPTIPFFSRPRHSTSFERRPVGNLPAFGFFRLPRRVPRSLLSDANQSQMQVASVKPNTVCMDEEKSGSSTLQKRRSITLLDKKFGYFRLPCGHSRRTRHYRGRAGAWHGMCELTHGVAGERHGNAMGAAWERHAMCESVFNIPYTGGCSHSFIYSWWWVWTKPETCRVILQ